MNLNNNEELGYRIFNENEYKQIKIWENIKSRVITYDYIPFIKFKEKIKYERKVVQ